MLEPVGLAEKKLESYQGIAEDALLAEVYRLGRELRGLRLGHISSTPFGGGISEILYALVPLERDLGLKVDWYTTRGSSERFLRISKLIHNALQGASVEMAEADTLLYHRHNRELAQGFRGEGYDVIIVHSHNLLALPHYVIPGQARWLWRCHLDTSTPAGSVLEFLKPIIKAYHGAIFTREEFVLSRLELPLVGVMPPAIDPLSPKNRDLPQEESVNFISDLGIDPRRPLLLHVSRLDPWKDPSGLLAAYYLAKERIPDLQFVIISSLTLDDPETFATLRLVDAEAAKDEDIHVYTNMDGFGDLEVNAFQRVCNVSVVKPWREGFGLSVSETLWKKRPVLGSRVGGLTLQLVDKLDYCLVSSVAECAVKLVQLISNKDFAQELGNFGHEHIRRHFLIPRLVRDELAFLKLLLNQPR